MKITKFKRYLIKKVPEFTNGEFKIEIFFNNFDIVSTKNRIPVLWGYKDICQHWFDLEYLKKREEELLNSVGDFDTNM